jgi:two-component system nitrate/nitrite response regulator NarL
MRKRHRQLSVVVADDHQVVLQGVASVLRSHADMNVVAVCSDGVAAMNAIRELSPEVAVLDISMPGLNGLDVLTTINMEKLKTKVIILTATVTDGQILTAITGGAKGIMLKDTAPDNLVRYVRKVAAGQRWFPTSLVDAGLERDPVRQVENRYLLLTSRQREVMLLVSEGLTNKAIGRHLQLSEGTVKVHLHNIYNKLGVANRTALAVLAIMRRAETE